jgi:membrane protein YdbS with pleckstrin-like domain
MSSAPAGRTSADGEPRSLYAGRRARKDVVKYLLPGEEAIIATRRHWAVLLEPVAKSLPVVVLGGWLLAAADRDAHVIRGLGVLLLLAALGYLALRLAEWHMRHFIVSPRRMMLTSGVIARTVTLLPRRRITDLTWQETFGGQLLGYGTFRIESAGQDQALSKITFLPRADLLYRRISELLFPGDAVPPGDEFGDDEPSPTAPPPPPAPPPPAGRHDTQPIPGLPPADG